MSHVAKIFEREIHTQILAYLTKHDLISPFQSAYLKYLKKHSTTTCLHRVVDDLLENVDDSLIAGIVFLDIKIFCSGAVCVVCRSIGRRTGNTREHPFIQPSCSSSTPVDSILMCCINMWLGCGE